MSNGKVVNPAGQCVSVCHNSYYSVQYGLCVGIAFFKDDIWCVTGYPAVHTDELKHDMIVFKHIIRQTDLLADANALQNAS